MHTRIGIVTEYDPATGKARVSLPDDDIVTDWLAIVVPSAAQTSFTQPLDVNEQVAVVLDEDGENGFIMGATYNADKTPKNSGKDISAVTFSDGSTISFDRSSHTFTLDLKGGNVVIKTDADVQISCVNATVTASGKTKLDTPETECTGNLKVAGNLEITGNTTGSGNFSTSGNLSVFGDSQIAGRLNAGDVETVGDVRAGAGVVGLLTHTHAAAGAVGTPTPGIG